jgi:hypothetical protein
MDDVCVVHLIRRGDSLDGTRRFAASYAGHETGMRHRLVVVLKGFASPEEAQPYKDAIGEIANNTLRVTDEGFDLTAYDKVARQLDSTHLCFLNAHSVILRDGWLAIMRSALGRAGIGAVGATGSWQSSLDSTRYLRLHLPSAYSTVFPDRAWVVAQLGRLSATDSDSGDAPALGSRLMAVLGDYAGVAYVQAGFRRFPAHHLRTNAFMIPTEIVRRLRIPRLRFKQQAWRLEAGRGSITTQLSAMDLRPVVVGSDGATYERDEWDRSATLWQEQQQNLLVADNQTDSYRLADSDLRRVLSGLAWGNRARAAPPINK